MKQHRHETLVLKVGTSTLVDNETLDGASFARIGRQVSRLRQAGHGVILVSSSTRNRLTHTGWKQVVALWDQAIGGNTQDFLLTETELDRRGGCEQLIAASLAGRVAIANADDDSLSHSSHYRSNDIVGAQLALHAASRGQSVQYGMLSDVHGVLRDVAMADSVIATISDLETHWHLAGGTGSVGATGGMATKFAAVEMVRTAGVESWIAHGRTENIIELAMTGQAGTLFSRANQREIVGAMQ